MVYSELNSILFSVGKEIKKKIIYAKIITMALLKYINRYTVT